MRTVNQCCCGCTLRTGSIIIGIFYLIVSGAFLILYSATASVLAQDYDSAVQAVFIVLAVIYGLQFVANVLLLVAVFADKHVLFLPWLIIHIIVCTLTTIGYLTSAILYFILPAGVGIGLGVASIIVMIIGLGLQVYFIIVVYSLYKEIKGQ